MADGTDGRFAADPFVVEWSGLFGELVGEIEVDSANPLNYRRK